MIIINSILYVYNAIPRKKLSVYNFPADLEQAPTASSRGCWILGAGCWQIRS
jgi:hypothetical protein